MPGWAKDWPSKFHSIQLPPDNKADKGHRNSTHGEARRTKITRRRSQARRLSERDRQWGQILQKSRSWHTKARGHQCPLRISMGGSHMVSLQRVGRKGSSQCGRCLGATKAVITLGKEGTVVCDRWARSGAWHQVQKDVRCHVICIHESLSVGGGLTVEYYTAVQKNALDAFWYEHYITEWKIQVTEQVCHAFCWQQVDRVKYRRYIEV